MPRRFKLYVGPVREKFSPHSGLLAIARVFRSLGLPAAIQQHLSPALAMDARRGRGELGIEKVLEWVVLLQAAGADPIQDMNFLKDDPCLNRALPDATPSSYAVRKFLESLGAKERETRRKLTMAFHNLLLKSVHRFWATEMEQQITVDLIVMPSFDVPHLAWAPLAPNELPKWIVCWWREADLILSGGLCREEKESVELVVDGLSSVPQRKGARLIRAGPLFHSPNISGPISRQWKTTVVNSTNFRREQHFPNRYGVAVPLSREDVAALDQDHNDWSTKGLQPSCGLEWTKRNGNEIALRRRIGDGKTGRHEYSAFVTNRHEFGGDVANWFLAGAPDVHLFTNDFGTLTFNANPGSQNELTSEGRFRVAMLTYNICSRIRHSCLPDSKRHISLRRFRELIIHAPGWISTKEGTQWFRIGRQATRLDFAKIQVDFPIKGSRDSKKARKEPWL